MNGPSDRAAAPKLGSSRYPHANTFTGGARVSKKRVRSKDHVRSRHEIVWTWPLFTSGNILNSVGTSSRRCRRRADRARRTTTPILKRTTFCWKERFLSVVTRTSKVGSASLSKAPLTVSLHPIWRTVFTSWLGRSRRRRQSTHSSISILIQLLPKRALWFPQGT